MKNLKYILIAVFTIFICTSCLEEQYDIKDGGTYAAQLYAPVKIPYYFQETTSVEYAIETFENPGVSVSSIIATKQLFAGGVASTKATIDVTSGSFSQTTDQMFADVPVDGQVLTEDDLAPGDSWDISYVMTLSDGTELPISTVRNTNVPFSCVSAIPTEGTWTGTTTLGAFGIISTNASVTVSMIDDAGNYAMSDVTGAFYEAFGFAPDNPANINDLCNTITITSAPDAQFSITPEPDYDGSWDPVTETLDIAWYDDLNDIHEVTTHSRN